MDRRRPAHRAAAWLMALLLALVALEPLRAHACPTHDAAMAAADAHAGHAGHGDHGAPAAPDERHPCDCLGSCGLAAAVALPAAPVAAVDGDERLTTAPPATTSPTTVALARERLLPFANGPPARG